MIKVHITDTETGVNTESEFEPNQHDYIMFLTEDWKRTREKKSRNGKSIKIRLEYVEPTPEESGLSIGSPGS
jgi:hypothetical protein